MADRSGSLVRWEMGEMDGCPSTGKQKVEKEAEQLHVGGFGALVLWCGENEGMEKRGISAFLFWSSASVFLHPHLSFCILPLFLFLFHDYCQFYLSYLIFLVCRHYIATTS